MPSRPIPRQLIQVVGRTVLVARQDAGWSQRDLSRRSGVPQAQICRIEKGLVRDLRASDIDRLFVALGVRYWLGVDPPRLERPQADLVHAWCSAYVARRLSASGWLVEPEVEVGGDRSRGWIDVLGFHPASSLLLVVEVKTEIRDIGAIERSMNWYQREAMIAAERFDWRPRSVTSALLVLHSAANDARVLASSPVFAAGFPGRAPDLQTTVDKALWSGHDRHLAMVDPRSRRSLWLRATRSDGRRTAAPYRDYVDAARLIESRRAASTRDRSAPRINVQ